MGVTWKEFARPGTTSIFIRKPVIQKLWITSGDRSWNSHGLAGRQVELGTYCAVPTSKTSASSMASSSV